MGYLLDLLLNVLHMASQSRDLWLIVQTFCQLRENAPLVRVIVDSKEVSVYFFQEIIRVSWAVGAHIIRSLWRSCAVGASPRLRLFKILCEKVFNFLPVTLERLWLLFGSVHQFFKNHQVHFRVRFQRVSFWNDILNVLRRSSWLERFRIRNHWCVSWRWTFRNFSWAYLLVSYYLCLHFGRCATPNLVLRAHAVSRSVLSHNRNFYWSWPKYFLRRLESWECSFGLLSGLLGRGF
jgi:hypothetical protein